MPKKRNTLRRIAAIPQDICAPFHAEARQLETQLLTVYQMIAVITKNVDDLSQVAPMWKTVVFMCDAFSRRLGELVKAHPQYGADAIKIGF